MKNYSSAFAKAYTHFLKNLTRLLEINKPNLRQMSHNQLITIK